MPKLKAHRPGRFLPPDATVLVPLAILFATTLEGATVSEAVRRSVGLFFSPHPGIAMWLQVALLNLALYIYAAPAFRLHSACEFSPCAHTERDVDLAMKRLDGLSRFVTLASVAIFALGGLLRYESGADALAGPSKAFLRFMESSVTGLFVGVILSLQFENRLYGARATVIGLGTRRSLRYSSLYSRLILVTCSIALFLIVQVFSSAGSFFALGLQSGADALPRAPLGAPLDAWPSDPLSGPEFILRYGHFAGVKNALNVFAFRLAIFSVFILQLVLQLKRTIRTPLVTVADRLKALNSPAPGSGKVIDILRNDEYARVFELINSLILRQRDQLEISRRRLEGIVEGAADPIIALDPAGAIRIFNPAAEAAFGYERTEAIGKGLDLLLPGAPPSSALRELGSEGASARLARRPWRRKDGSLVTMESHLSRDCERDEAWTTLILRDVSRQAEIERSLTRARTDAENANRMKSEFLANMSHELRTPLNAILGYTQLMADDRNLTDAQREKIGVISRSGEHLLALINDILDISKIEAGKMELRAQTFDLRRFVADLGDMFDLKCRKKGLALYVETLTELPRYVEADLGKLRQVMINLLGNAVKFTSEGGVSILVGRDESDPSKIRFAVRDTGRGIPDAERELIMLPFVQASTTDHEGGTGLGLAISSRYIAMMGGSLEVASALGEGSTFSFSLRLPEREAPAEAGSAEEASLAVAPDTESTVLVVDDQPANRLLLKEMLERSGFTVAEAADGREAIERAREMEPDMIFMDIKMPVMDGYEAVAALKRDPATAGIRVFALTASAFSHDEERIAAAGFDGFLAKPFKLGALYRLIRERGGVALRQARAAPAVPAPGPEGSGPIDFAAAAAALGEDGRSALEEAALINDFASLAARALSLREEAPAFAAALKAAADSYDEARVAELLSGLGSPQGGRS